MNWDLRHRRSSLVIRGLLAVWITVIVVVLCATGRWWGLVFVVPLVFDLYLLYRILAAGARRWGAMFADRMDREAEPRSMEERGSSEPARGRIEVAMAGQEVAGDSAPSATKGVSRPEPAEGRSRCTCPSWSGCRGTPGGPSRRPCTPDRC